MGVIQSDLDFYGSANMPDGDGATTGGAVDFGTRMFFTDVRPAGEPLYYRRSGSVATTTITVYGYNTVGALVSETITLTNQSNNGSITFLHLLKGVVGGTTPDAGVSVLGQNAVIAAHQCQSAANATATTAAYLQLKAGDGASVAVGELITLSADAEVRRIISLSGDFAYVNKDWSVVPSSGDIYNVFRGMQFEFSPNRVSQIRRPFYNAASDIPGGSARTYYEKIFAVNNNTTYALSSALIKKLTDPVGATDYQFALTNSLNDTGTVANRQTAPASGITSFTTGSAPQSIAVPSPQVLPNGAAPNAAGAQGVWLKMTLNAGLSSSYTFSDMNIDGASP